jgi:hypothetical protein
MVHYGAPFTRGHCWQEQDGSSRLQQAAWHSQLLKVCQRRPRRRQGPRQLFVIKRPAPGQGTHHIADHSSCTSAPAQGPRCRRADECRPLDQGDHVRGVAGSTAPPIQWCHSRQCCRRAVGKDLMGSCSKQDFLAILTLSRQPRHRSTRLSSRRRTGSRSYSPSCQN